MEYLDTFHVHIYIYTILYNYIYISLCTKSMLVVTTKMGAAWHEPIWAHLELPEPFCKAGAGGGDAVVSKSFSVAKWTFQNSDVQTNEPKFGKESSNANSYWKSGQCLERSHFTATTKENNAIILSFMYILKKHPAHWWFVRKWAIPWFTRYTHKKKSMPGHLKASNSAT